MAVTGSQLNALTYTGKVYDAPCFTRDLHPININVFQI